MWSRVLLLTIGSLSHCTFIPPYHRHVSVVVALHPRRVAVVE